MIERLFTVGLRFCAVAMLLAVAACSSSSRMITLEDRDEALEFQKSLQDYSGSVNDLLRDTRHGKAISDFTVGMLAYDILTTVSSADSGLYAHFTAGGIDIEDYLKTKFQTNPDGEIAAMDKIGGEGSPTLRAVARHTLDALAHIPDSHDPPALQRQNREQLENALQNAKSALDTAAQEVKIP